MKNKLMLALVSLVHYSSLWAQQESPELFIPTEKNGLLGLRNALGEMVIEPQYTAIDFLPDEFFSTADYAMVSKGMQTGLLHLPSKKEWLKAPQTLDPLIPKSDGYIIWMGVSQGAFDGVYRIDQTEVLPRQYKNIYYMGNDLFIVKDPTSGKRGIVDNKNQVVLPLEYQYITAQQTGVAVATKQDNEKYLIGKDGKKITEVAFSDISPVYNSPHIFHLRQGSIMEAVYGIYNSQTGALCLPKYGPTGSVCTDNRLAVTTKDANGKMICGYVDAQFKEVIPLIYKNNNNFSEQKAWVLDFNKKLLCIDTAGKVLFQKKDVFFMPAPFQNGMAVIRRNDEYILLDGKGKELAKLPAGEEPIIGKQYLLLKTDRKYGIATLKGQWTAQPQYGWIRFVSDNVFVIHNENPDSYSFIDASGKAVFEGASFKEVFEKNGVWVVTNDKLQGLVADGKMIFEANNTELYFSPNNRWVLASNAKQEHRIYNLETQKMYDRVQEAAAARFLSDNLVYFLDTNGRFKALLQLDTGNIYGLQP